MKRILKFIKNLLQRLRALKYQKSITYNLEGINLLLIRDTFTKKSVIGELFLNGERFCDTLELPYKDNQRSISCIVPNRDYILFHRGNSAKDTRGCILVGQGSQQDVVHNSTLAMDLLVKEIINLGGEKINLTIKNK